MKTIRLLAIFVCVLGFCSCGKKKVMAVRWDGGSRMEDTKWKVDNKPVGKGVAGYQQFLKLLAERPDHSYLEIYYPGVLWNRNVPGYFVMDVFPFQDKDALRKQFEAITIRKDIGFETIPEY